MKYLIIFIGTFLMTSIGFSQGRIVISNDAFIRISNNANIVVDNPNDNAILTTGTGGNIVSEGENNQLIWMTKGNTGTYTLPFTTLPAVNGGNQTKIPYTINITTAGVGANGKIHFSTYETTSDLNIPYPTGVSNVGHNSVDNSLNVIDRFWRIEAQNYTTKPAVTMSFTYDDAANEIGFTNTIVEANLQAQRWNSTTSDWEGLLLGTANPASNTVANVVVPASDFYRSWTLVNNSVPLPVELIAFDVTCQQSKVVINWSTATEINNDYFVIEKSADAVNFFEVTTIYGAGNSNTLLDYSYIDKNNSSGVNYYRLKQVDFDGTTTYSQLISMSDCNNEGDLNIQLYPNPAVNNVTLHVQEPTNTQISILNDIGQEVFFLDHINQTKTTISVAKFSKGIYLVKVQNGQQQKMIKLVKQ